MGNKNKSKQLAKFLEYLLGRRPDEFGLVPDENGFVKLKDLLKACSEEEGWRFVRESHLKEILLTVNPPPFEISEKMIRARRRDHLPHQTKIQAPPKLLFVCVRTRAHGHVLEKGIRPSGYSHIILASTKEMAQRIGRRIDPTPVLFTVHVQKALAEGVEFIKAGESLFLAEQLSPNCLSGPPLPKEKFKELGKKPPKEPAVQETPGSFLVDLNDIYGEQKGSRRKSSQKKDSWKHNKKRLRRQKQKSWPQ
jgi:putative RNA 2'-phosphotransferase